MQQYVRLILWIYKNAFKSKQYTYNCIDSLLCNFIALSTIILAEKAKKDLI